MNKQLGKFRDQSGQALLEFALVIGLLLFILMGMFVVGFWMSAKQAVTLAAAQGSRQAALTLNNALAEASVREALKGFDSSGNKTIVAISPESPWSGDRVRGNFITVKVTYNMPFTFAFFDSHFKNGSPFKTVTSVASARIECVPDNGPTCEVGRY